MEKDEFIISLLSEMESNVAEAIENFSNTIQTHRTIAAAILHILARLKTYISTYQFQNPEEEINFFKTIKPKFLSKLIYHQKVFEIESRIPLGSVSNIKAYYEKQLQKINQYLNNNEEFFVYYRSHLDTWDHKYFVRQEPASWLMLNFEEYETDLNFTTIYDHKLSKIIAYESLSVYLNESVDRLTVGQNKNYDQGAGNEKNIKWTSSKAALIELIYALQSTGCFNNGAMDVKQLATHVEKSLHIELGNYYRLFQEIRIRKTSRTAFLDLLKERLLLRMDESDLNPRFK